VIFNQRLKILKNSDISIVLSDFLEEIVQKLLIIKNDYEKSNDKKIYLTSIKNYTGNIINDDGLILLADKQKADFLNEFQNIFNKKRLDRVNLIGEKQNRDLERRIFLQVIDHSWRTHLQYLEQLRQVIGLRSYGQKDPLSEFKKEAFALFEGLLEKIKNDVIKFLLNLNIVISNEERKEEKQSEIQTDNKKIGRNEKCPCGSGKKYKHCCGSA